MYFFRRLLGTLKNVLVNLFFPRTCISCGKGDHYLCEMCFLKISLLSKPQCPVCKKFSPQFFVCSSVCRQSTHLDALVVGSFYTKNDILPRAIHLFKYGFASDLAPLLSQIFTLQLQAYYPELLFEDPSSWLIVPVPLHKKRLKWRGFNQSELLAAPLSNITGVPVKNALIRIKNTVSQTKLSRKKRMENVRDAFRIASGHDVRGSNILLIDDICTTCSTLNECAKVLKEEGAGQILGMVLGRGA